MASRHHCMLSWLASEEEPDPSVDVRRFFREPPSLMEAISILKARSAK